MQQKLEVLIKPDDVKLEVGEKKVVSVGLLPQAAAYKTYLMETRIAAELRGDVPQVLVQGGGLTVMGSPVFNGEGKRRSASSAIRRGQSILLESPGREAIVGDHHSLQVFRPRAGFSDERGRAPHAGKAGRASLVGHCAQLTGLGKDVAEALDLKNKPAIQIGEVIPNTAAADKAGLKQGDIILKLNGQRWSVGMKRRSFRAFSAAGFCVIRWARKSR